MLFGLAIINKDKPGFLRHSQKAVLRPLIKKVLAVYAEKAVN
jgi:hypothetical protein